MGDIVVSITSARLCAACGYEPPLGSKPDFVTLFLSSYRVSLCKTCAEKASMKLAQVLSSEENNG